MGREGGEILGNPSYSQLAFKPMEGSTKACGHGEELIRYRPWLLAARAQLHGGGQSIVLHAESFVFSITGRSDT